MKKIIQMAALALSLSACTTTPSASVTEDTGLRLLVGSYNPADTTAIQVYSFDEESGDFNLLQEISGIDNPSFLCANSEGNTIYAVSEFDDPEPTALHAFHFNKADGSMEMFSSQANNAGAPCNIIVSPLGDYVACANYWGGSMTLFPLTEDGQLSEPTTVQYEGQGPHANQTQPHVHAINFTPDNKYLLANDLGLDCIHVYPLNVREKGDTIPLIDQQNGYDVKVDAGAGPRHLCWTPDGKFAYAIAELSGQLFTFSYQNEKLELVNSIVADTIQGGGSADIHITNDGKFLYASHRLKGDGISIYRVNAENGDLQRVGYQTTGIHPRNFALTPNNKFLLVACRDTNEIQIFARDAETGLLTDTGKKITFNKPVFVKFME